MAITTHNAQGLKSILRESGMTQRDLARALDRPDATVNKWANGLTPNDQNRAAIVTAINEVRAGSDLAPISPFDIWKERDGRIG